MKVSKLYRHPIKSCRAQVERSLSFDALGATGDRRWMVVRKSDGRFLSQRGTSACPGTPRMAMIKGLLSDHQLYLDAPRMPILPLLLGSHYDERLVSVHRDNDLRVKLVSTKADQWLSQYLQMEVQLVEVPSEVDNPFQRQINPNYSQTGRHVSFADGYPFLLVSEESVADLRGHMRKYFSAEVFRPNIVVSGIGAAYREDSWKVIRIGNSLFDVAKHCERCVMINVDQETAEVAKKDGPLMALGQYRVATIDDESKILFGVNLIHRSWPETISIGDEVEVLELRSDDEMPVFKAD